MARPSVKWIKENFYLSSDGRLFWKTSGTGRDLGRPCGYHERGYIRVKTKGRRTPAHQIVWVLIAGDYPECGKMIDHIDGDGTNNHPDNLRSCTNQQNQFNRYAKNVSFCKQTGKWRVSLMIDGKRLDFGRHSSGDVARIVAADACKKYHKEFCYG